jgi:hypothetical protein
MVSIFSSSLSLWSRERGALCRAALYAFSGVSAGCGIILPGSALGTCRDVALTEATDALVVFSPFVPEGVGGFRVRRLAHVETGTG